VTWLLPASPQEFAEPCDVGVLWSAAAPRPIVIASGGRLNLVVRLAEGDAMPNVREGDPQPYGIIVFDRCHAFTFGPPDDEGLSGHRLTGRGLTPYEAHTVLRSAWAAAEQRPEMTHFLLSFKDETLECLAVSVSSVRRVGTLADLLAHVGTWMS
jgi:hypothetical protein